MNELVPPGVPTPGPGRDDCDHDQRIEGICTACGHCMHEVVLNAACLYCGTTDLDPVAMSPKKTGDVVPVDRLRRRPEPGPK